VGDAQFQQKCLGKMDEVSRREGRTVLFCLLRHGEEVKARILFETRAPVANAAVWLSVCDLGGNPTLHYDTDF
jgi:hypothetical protein